jgi:anaerobic ribonucleoside-triphosphate reductase activating protein
MPKLLHVAYVHSPVTVLGPGIRVGVWLKGCPLKCPFCIAPTLHTQEGSTLVTVDGLVELTMEIIEECKADGVTITGGEPFSQAENLIYYLKGLRERGVDDILIYSGYKYVMLKEEFPWVNKLITALVDGPFMVDKPTEAPWKGSENQELTVFDKKYEGIYEKWKNNLKRDLQFVKVDRGKAFRIIGIPKIDKSLYDKFIEKD